MAAHDDDDIVEELERAQFKLDIVLAVAEHDRILVLASAQSNLSRDARKKWIRDIRDNQAYLERFFEAQPPRQLIGNKINFLGDLSNRRLGLLADAIAIGLAAQDP